MATAEVRSTHPIRKVTSDEIGEVVATLSEAFYDDPVIRWWIGDDQRRSELLPGAMRLFAEMSLELESVYATHSLVAAAVWVPPGKQPTEQEMEQLVPEIEKMAQEHAERAFQMLTLMEEKHPKQDHEYLFLLGTRKAWQGQGMGSALMRPVLEECDRRLMPAYLEATSEDNKRLYLRHGFKVVDEIRLPDGPTAFCMWREPIAAKV